MLLSVEAPSSSSPLPRLYGWCCMQHRSSPLGTFSGGKNWQDLGRINCGTFARHYLWVSRCPTQQLWDCYSTKLWLFCITFEGIGVEGVMMMVMEQIGTVSSTRSWWFLEKIVARASSYEECFVAPTFTSLPRASLHKLRQQQIRKCPSKLSLKHKPNPYAASQSLNIVRRLILLRLWIQRASKWNEQNARNCLRSNQLSRELFIGDKQLNCMAPHITLNIWRGPEELS